MQRQFKFVATFKRTASNGHACATAAAVRDGLGALHGIADGLHVRKTALQPRRVEIKALNACHVTRELLAGSHRGLAGDRFEFLQFFVGIKPCMQEYTLRFRVTAGRVKVFSQHQPDLDETYDSRL